MTMTDRAIDPEVLAEQVLAEYPRDRLLRDALGSQGLTPVEVAVAAQVELQQAEGAVAEAARLVTSAHNYTARLYLDG